MAPTSVGKIRGEKSVPYAPCMVNVGKYSIHAAFGCGFQSEVFTNPICCLFESVPFLGRRSPFFLIFPIL